jgi:hypothetical protein
VQTPSRLLSLPWESAQEFLARCIAAYPTVHPLVEQFRAVGVSRPVDLTGVQVDKGAGRSPRFISRYEKPLIGATGQSGFLSVHEATDDASQANADTLALTMLNLFRRHRWGGAPGRASGDANSTDIFGNAMSVDLN